MRLLLLNLLVLCVLFAAPFSPAQIWWEPPEKREGPVDKLRVDAAITLGVEFLKKKQRQNGSFPGHGKAYPMGMTALCLLTLAKSGVQLSDPAVTRALDYVRYMPFKKTYSTGCLLMALEALHPENAEEWAKAGVKFLLDTRQVRHGGTWGYPANNYKKTGNLGRPDLSNTQYAVLGLRSGKRLGVKVPAEAFTDVVEFLTRNQRDMGAFNYLGNQQGTGSMTTAGLGIIAIAESAVGKTEVYSRIRADGKTAFKNGMKWFIKNYTVEWNPFGDEGGRNKRQLAYYLYGIERFCDIRGIQFVGEHDWYDDGARFLLANQGHEGNWGRMENTCFAILFLSRSNLSVSREIRTEAVAGRRAELKQQRRTRKARLKPPDRSLVPYIRDWLVIGPIRVRKGNPLDLQEHPRPRGKPSAGAISLKKKWCLYRSPTDCIDLEKFLKKGDRRLAYAATHFRVQEKQDALLWLGTRDAWRIWLNGREVQSRQVRGLNGKDRWRIPCKFRKGINTMILLLEDFNYEWTFHCRVSDPEGAAIPGLLNSTSIARLRKMARNR